MVGTDHMTGLGRDEGAPKNPHNAWDFPVPELTVYGARPTDPVAAGGTLAPDPADTHVIVTRSPAANEVADTAEAVQVLPLLKEQEAIAVPPFLAKETVQLPLLTVPSVHTSMVRSDSELATITL
jgi:hypothetical protein